MGLTLGLFLLMRSRSSQIAQENPLMERPQVFRERLSNLSDVPGDREDRRYGAQMPKVKKQLPPGRIERRSQAGSKYRPRVKKTLRNGSMLDTIPSPLSGVHRQ